MGKKKYNIEDLYDVDILKFIDIFKTSPYVLNTEGGGLYYSEVFANLSYEEQLELFEVYLLKYFYYVYSHDIRDTMAHTGCTSIGMDMYFSEISATCDIPELGWKPDFVLTMEFFEPSHEDETRLASEFTLWIDDPKADGARAEIGFKWDIIRRMYGEEQANQMSRDVFDILKSVHSKLLEEEELYAWYVLNGINLEKLLLQDNVHYNGWDEFIEEAGKFTDGNI